MFRLGCRKFSFSHIEIFLKFKISPLNKLKNKHLEIKDINLIIKIHIATKTIKVAL